METTEASWRQKARSERRLCSSGRCRRVFEHPLRLRLHRLLRRCPALRPRRFWLHFKPRNWEMTNIMGKRGFRCRLCTHKIVSSKKDASEHARLGCHNPAVTPKSEVEEKSEEEEVKMEEKEVKLEEENDVKPSLVRLRQLLQCRSCPYVTTQAAVFARHVRGGEKACTLSRGKAALKNLNGRTDCSECPYKAPTPQLLLLHQRRQFACSRARAMKELSDLQGKTSCDHCPFKTDSSDKLRTHLQRTRRCAEAQGKVADFKCRNCPFTTFITASMRRHEESGERACSVQRIKAEVRALNGLRKCPNCPFEARSSMHLRIHRQRKFSCRRARAMKELNDLQGQTACSKCPYQAPTPYHLRVHQRRQFSCSRARAMKELSDLQGQTDCKYCNFQSTGADKLLKHLKSSRRCAETRGQVPQLKCKELPLHHLPSRISAKARDP